MKKRTVLLFGDSITHGAFDAEAGGWANRIGALANEVSIKNNFHPVVNTFNLGIGGTTTEDLLTRLEFETLQRVGKNDEAVFVFAFGSNDMAVLGETGKHAVSKEDFAINISKMITIARKFSDTIVFLTMPPVVEAITKHVGSNAKGKSRIEADVVEYNAVIMNECGSQSVDVIDVHEEYVKGEFVNLFVSDGLHPNAKGHELIFTEVKRYFEGKGIL